MTEPMTREELISELTRFQKLYRKALSPAASELSEEAVREIAYRWFLSDEHVAACSEAIHAALQHKAAPNAGGQACDHKFHEHISSQIRDSVRCATCGQIVTASTLLAAPEGRDVEPVAWRRCWQFDDGSVGGWHYEHAKPNKRPRQIIEPLYAADAIDALRRERDEARADWAKRGLLLEEVITTMGHADTFIRSREKMHPTGIHLWDELADKINRDIADVETLGNESALLIGGE